jgi:hypothetical protein
MPRVPSSSGSVQAEVGRDEGQVPAAPRCPWAGPGREERCQLQQGRGTEAHAVTHIEALHIAAYHGAFIPSFYFHSFLLNSEITSQITVKDGGFWRLLIASKQLLYTDLNVMLKW